MLIVIEGPDKTGKTTLAKAISTELGYEYKHFSAPKGSPADEYIDFLLNLKRPTVCDRFHLGELVYGPMFRGKAGITPLELATIERVMRLKQTILIHAVTPIDTANTRLVKSTEHEVVNVVQNIQAARGFAEVMPKTNAGPVLKYDGSSITALHAIIDEVVGLLREYGETLDPADYTGIGTVTGSKIVFVGEQVNKNVTWRGLPFDRGFASQFLLDTFQAARVPEKAVYLCNADKLTKKEALTLKFTGWTRFVALGAKASDKLARLGIRAYDLAHPQFIKRFHYKRKDRYVSQFKEIVACA